VHYDVDESSFIHCTLKIGSSFMAERIFAREQQHHLTNIVRFLAASVNEPVVGQIRGQIFEPYAHRVLCEGGVTVRVRCLEDGRSAELPLPRLTPQRLDSTASIPTLHDSQYGQPLSKIFAAADSVHQPADVYQITVSERHTINLAGINDIIKHMRRMPVRFFFCVPPDRFHTFEKQSFITADHKVAVRVPSQSQLQQWAMEIPLALSAPRSTATSTAAVSSSAGPSSISASAASVSP
jgi:hypothetical protein